ncbi:MAG: formate/nitrite transporter family protein [Planctomycetota bacterium]
MSELFGSDAFAPPEIAARVEKVGVAKTRLPLAATAMLSVLGGAFIGLGALFATVVTADASLSPAVSRVLSGVVFALGLLLVVVAGAELFTGNNLLVMAWADRRIRTRTLLRHWLVVFAGNAVGAFGLAVLVWWSGHTTADDGLIGARYLAIAAHKVRLPFGAAVASGVLCNVLVCLGVWMAFAGRSVVDKAVAVMFPVAAFVACGFEHSVANVYFFAIAWLLPAVGAPPVTLEGALGNLAPVVLGNLIGGGLFVALVYHYVYRRSAPPAA